MSDLPKAYDPSLVEEKWQSRWIEEGCFKADPASEKPAYSVVIPPPNVTGVLHLGHVLNNTIQDILVRRARQKGYEALWLPGTDHAGIATQVRVEKDLKQTTGRSRHDLGREAFLEKVWEWKEKHGGIIINQLHKLGCSCDWDRERFTMDEEYTKAVGQVFIELFKEGLIYRGRRMVNWCPVSLTALSDEEVIMTEQKSKLYTVLYKLEDGSGALHVATTRPETIMADVAVAVNPKDPRYAHLIGKNVMRPLNPTPIPIIGDEYVEIEFGTGALKITPAHDKADFEIGRKFNLEIIDILTPDGHINCPEVPELHGMDRFDARRKSVEMLEASGLMVNVEDYDNKVGFSERANVPIEPRLSMQWFLKYPCVKEAADAVAGGDITFRPARWAKTYAHWLENIQDWCISRQLWWGHQIPAWYCDACGHINVSREDPTKCEKCGCTKLTRDEDVLDTWFSSGLWPFSTLGWPDLNSEDLKYWYPTTDMVTGYDIIFFWVARMVVSGMEQMKKEPFKTVFIHGLVRDDKGRKMSKSLGNGIDPLEMAEKYGADALRFNLITGNSPGNDMRFYVEKCEAMRNFANKIWNASRYVLMNLTIDEPGLPAIEDLEQEDKWVLSKLNTLIREVTANLDAYEIGVASSKVYDFIWDTYCDWYIELTKTRLYSENEKSKLAAQKVLVYVLDQTLRLLHPFMPFITEEIWQTLPHEGATLMRTAWPVYDAALHFPEEEKEMERIMDAIRAIRNRRAEMNVPPSRKAQVYVETAFADTFESGRPFFSRLASAAEVTVGQSFDVPGAVSIVTADATIKIPMADLVDLEAEKARLQKEKETVQKQLDGVLARLSNEAFTSKAPEAVVNTARDNAARLQEKLALLQQSMEQLG